MSNQMVYGFLKFGRKEHIEALRNEGLLYMKPLQDFCRLEADMERGDEFEGTTRLTQSRDIKHFVIEGPGFGKHAVDPVVS